MRVRKELRLKLDYYGSFDNCAEYFADILILSVQNGLVNFELTNIRIFEKCRAIHKVLFGLFYMSAMKWPFLASFIKIDHLYAS